MPQSNAVSGSDAEVQARLAELDEQAHTFEAEKNQVKTRELELRAQEDPLAHVSFARQIFELQQRQRVLEVEIDLVRKRMRRLRLGYTEEAAPIEQPTDGFLF